MDSDVFEGFQFNIGECVQRKTARGYAAMIIARSLTQTPEGTAKQYRIRGGRVRATAYEFELERAEQGNII
jgi:hypothetical protein